MRRCPILCMFREEVVQFLALDRRGVRDWNSTSLAHYLFCGVWSDETFETWGLEVEMWGRALRRWMGDGGGRKARKESKRMKDSQQWTCHALV
jgi:hypothetical protein